MEKKVVVIAIFFMLVLFSVGFAEETLTITTYYPSPYGSYNELTTSSNTYLATSGGNVGIGTTAPGAKLEVNGTVKVNNAITGWTSLVSQNDVSNLDFARAAGDQMGQIRTYNQFYDALVDRFAFYGGAAKGSSKIITYEPIYGGTTNSANLYLRSTDQATKGNVIIADDGGNVGIGTTAPTAKLHILGQTTAFDADDIIIQNKLGNDLLAGIALRTVSMADYGRFAIFGNGSPNTTTAVIEMYPNDTFTSTARDLLIQTSGYPGSDIILSPQGNVGIGMTNPATKLHVNGKVKISDLSFVSGAPVYRENITNVLGISSSDIRLKENMVTIPNSLEKVLKLRGINFNWKKDKEKKLALGMIAQEVMQVVPEAVYSYKTDDGKTYYGIYYAELTSLLVNAIKEQQQEFASLKSKIDTQQKQIQDLQKRIQGE